MGREIERKFLITKLPEVFTTMEPDMYISQAYVDTNITIRIRLIEWCRPQRSEAVMTIKKAVEGFTRLEYEFPIPHKEAYDMIVELCGGKVMEKERFRFIYPLEGENRHIWEIDIFHGQFEGLILAEIELSSEDEKFEKPSWIGEEVTSDKQYTNENMFRGMKDA